jgi:hypothetical protein
MGMLKTLGLPATVKNIVLFLDAKQNVISNNAFTPRWLDACLSTQMSYFTLQCIP